MVGRLYICSIIIYLPTSVPYIVSYFCHRVNKLSKNLKQRSGGFRVIYIRGNFRRRSRISCPFGYYKSQTAGVLCDIAIFTIITHTHVRLKFLYYSQDLDV